MAGLAVCEVVAGCHQRREMWWDRGRCAATISMHVGGRRDVGGRVERAYGDWLSAAVVGIVGLAVLGE
jgi:hypothetical protein